MRFSHNECMQLAFAEAIKAKDLHEVPVGAIVTKENKIIGRGYNSVIRDNSIACHAELNAINDASKTLNNYRLLNCNLYVTLEPCHMCAKAIVDARIKNVYFATLEPKTGSVISIDNFFDKSFLNHKVHYFSGLMQEESSRLLKDFFLDRRS
jgi:tRNA(adenine34) deaminase